MKRFCLVLALILAFTVTASASDVEAFGSTGGKFPEPSGPQNVAIDGEQWYYISSALGVISGMGTLSAHVSGIASNISKLTDTLTKTHAGQAATKSIYELLFSIDKGTFLVFDKIKILSDTVGAINASTSSIVTSLGNLVTIKDSLTEISGKIGSSVDYSTVLNNIYLKVSSIESKIKDYSSLLSGIHSDTSSLLSSFEDHFQMVHDALYDPYLFAPISDYIFSMSNDINKIQRAVADQVDLDIKFFSQNSEKAFRDSFSQDSHGSDITGMHGLSGSITSFWNSPGDISQAPGMFDSFTDTMGLWFSGTTKSQISVGGASGAAVLSAETEDTPLYDQSQAEVQDILGGWIK